VLLLTAEEVQLEGGGVGVYARCVGVCLQWGVLVWECTGGVWVWVCAGVDVISYWCSDCALSLVWWVCGIYTHTYWHT